jgi:hypothetical protein
MRASDTATNAAFGERIASIQTSVQRIEGLLQGHFTEDDKRFAALGTDTQRRHEENVEKLSELQTAQARMLAYVLGGVAVGTFFISAFIFFVQTVAIVIQIWLMWKSGG